MWVITAYKHNRKLVTEHSSEISAQTRIKMLIKAQIDFIVEYK